MAEYYLGLDSSTQSMTAVLLDAAAGKCLAEVSVAFDDLGAAYGVRHGVIEGEEPGEVFGHPALWAKGLEEVLGRLQAAGHELSQIRAVSGSGQQHGTVYLNDRAEPGLAALDPARGLEEQAAEWLATPTSPIWQDSSTTAELREMVEAIGRNRFFELTGNAPFERFSGPQIRKMFRRRPEVYAATRHIALVSSYLASLLAGRIAPWDEGDAGGTHLLEINAKRLHPDLLAATAEGLEERLPGVVPSAAVVGPLSPYFVARFGFAPECAVIACSGDNPCSLIGLGLLAPGQAALSLGTSDTLFACTAEPRRSWEGAVFPSPDGHHYMALLCKANGSLARERVLKACGYDWTQFSAALEATPPGNDGAMMLPFFVPEITPKTSKPLVMLRGFSPEEPRRYCRAVIEAQAFSLKIRSEYLGGITALAATGGASQNKAILQVFADVFQCDVSVLETPNSAALGAALRAYHAGRAAAGKPTPWADLVEPFTRPLATVVPRHTEEYLEPLAAYREFETEFTQNGE